MGTPEFYFASDEMVMRKSIGHSRAKNRYALLSFRRDILQGRIAYHKSNDSNPFGVYFDNSLLLLK
jgi:hypothetical protein